MKGWPPSISRMQLLPTTLLNLIPWAKELERAVLKAMMRRKLKRKLKSKVKEGVGMSF